jgi:2-dehydro-3-deoxyphosphooctonate aldolase (KDO 8-P synthase)
MLASIPKIQYLDKDNFFLIAGPCVVEGEDITFEIARKVKALSDKHEIPFIFKASFRKANRTRLDSFTGLGDATGLQILAAIGKELNVPTITDIHESTDAALAAQYVDVLQIPAFLCRQTELLVAAAKTNKVVNVKKGQFLAPESMQFAVNKLRESGNDKIILTERGTMLGYQDIVVDYRGIPEMQKNRVPVVMDITHSLQQPNQISGVTGGRPDLIGTIAKAAIAVGADGIFVETHPNPSKALSDGANMLHLDHLEALLVQLIKIRRALK